MTPALAKAVLARLPRAIATRLAATLDGAAADVANEIRRLFIARAPDQSPGQPLAGPSSVADAITAGHDPQTRAATVTVALPYAADLEYGTAHRAARPFLRPAVDRALPDLRDRCVADLKRAAAEELGSP